jgi:hypothetical protein
MKIKKIVKWFFGLILLLAVLVILPSFFYHPELNTLPLPSHYKKGVYHIHSNFSDGRGTLQEITRAARQLNLDFVILTDHGNPNILSLKSTTWMNDVLLIGGSELTLNSGHLATAGYPVPDFILPPEPQEAIADINQMGGFNFISHPFDDNIPWTDWNIHGLTGIEVFNSYSSARRAGIFKLLFFPFQYAVNSKYALLNTLSYPVKNMAKWDSLNEKEKCFAIYCTDAHAQLPITKNFKLHFPSYKSMFEIFQTYVKLENDLVKDPNQSASAVISAIKKGHFFNAVEAISPANGFENYFIGSDGETSEMGDTTAVHRGKFIIRVPYDFETRVIVKKNGEPITEIKGNRKKNLEFAITDPGIYRAEIFVSQNRFSHVPWILTNPIFVGVKHSLTMVQLPLIQKKLVDRENFFIVETSRLSRGKAVTVVNNRGESITAFTYRLEKEPEQKNFWSALSNRNRFDFSSHGGILFQARSRHDARFWIEFRCQNNSGECWYRHSFRAGKSWKTVYIPFDEFPQINGEKTAPALDRITSLFFSINNAIAYSGSRGILFLKDIGLTGRE